MDLLQGQECLVFAAGVDDRVTPQKPAYPFFQQANVQACVRVLRLAKQAGIKRAVVLGSYFAHFERLWPHLKLVERHPYIRSRVEQEIAVTSIPGLEVMVLELLHFRRHARPRVEIALGTIDQIHPIHLYSILYERRLRLYLGKSSRSGDRWGARAWRAWQVLSPK